MTTKTEIVAIATNVLGEGATGTRDPKTLEMVAKLHALKKGESLTYMCGTTGDPIQPIGRMALAYYGSKKVSLTQRRLTDSTTEKSSNGTFEYIAQGLTDAVIVPTAFKYLDD